MKYRQALSLVISATALVTITTTTAASANGNGNGAAVGQPAPGTVGNADDKAPRGQMPNADADGNNGYECDGNAGIGRGNPAHTGCTVTPPDGDWTT